MMLTSLALIGIVLPLFCFQALADDCIDYERCINPRKDAMFGLGVEYAYGKRPTVAMLGNNSIITMHDTRRYSTYMIGVVSTLTINWTHTDNVWAGGFAQVTANSIGDVIYVYQMNGIEDDNNGVFYRFGRFNGQSIDWEVAQRVSPDDVGMWPSIAMNDYGTTLMAYENGPGRIVYKLAKVSGKALKFRGRTESLANGTETSLAINNGGLAVASFVRDGTLFYMVGSIKRNRIGWSSAISFGPGRTTSITLNDDGFVILAYRDYWTNRIHSASGSINGSRIDFSSPFAFDKGDLPRVAANKRFAVQVHSDNKYAETKLWYSVSLLVDRSRWMEDTPEIHKKQLWEITLPGSHDSGAYNLCRERATGCTKAPTLGVEFLDKASGILTGKVARAQTQDLLGQLRGGVRFLDLRLYYWKKTKTLHAYHDSINMDNVTTNFIHIRDFLASSKKEVVILVISHFCKSNFNSERHKELVGLIQQYLGDYLYMSPWEQAPYNDTFEKITANGSKLILGYFSPYVNKLSSGSGFWPKRVFRIYDRYSNTQDLEKMAVDQIKKLEENEGSPDRLFLLSYTLTFNPTDTTGGIDDVLSNIHTLHQITKPASRSLATTVRDRGRDNKINILYVDYFEEARVTDVAIWINRNWS